MHIAEVVVVVVIRRTLPPVSRRTCGAVTVFHLAVSSGVIRILHAGIAGSSGNSAVAGACNGHCLCQIGCVQRYRACAQGHATSGLADAPGHGLVRGRAIRPHIISFGSEGSVVAGGIGASGRTAQGELCAVVVAPGRSLRVTVVGQRTTLSGDV